MKRIIVFALAALAISVSACQQRSTGITEPSTYSTPVTMTEVERTQVWIDRIDPFVSQNPDQTWNLDSDSFYQKYAPRGNDTVTVTNLMGGIGTANQQVLKVNQGLSPEGIIVSFHWWGWTACFEGNAAYNFRSIVSGGVALIPGVGIYIAVPLYVGLDIYAHQHGDRFCINAYWWNKYAIWLSCC